MMQVIWLIVASLLVYILCDRLIARIRNSSYQPLIKTILRVVLLAIIVMTILPEFGLEINAILTSFGITGLAVSLASRELLGNIISGIAIHIYKPFDLGDIITVKGFTGKVIQINIRFTVLENSTGTVLLPNRLLLSEPIVIAA